MSVLFAVKDNDGENVLSQHNRLSLAASTSGAFHRQLASLTHVSSKKKRRLCAHKLKRQNIMSIKCN